MKRILHIMGGMNRAGAESMIMTIYRAIDKTKFQFDFLVYSKDHQDFEDEILSLGGRVIHNPSCGSGFKSITNIRKVLKQYGPYCAIHAATLHNSAFALLSTIGIKQCRRIVHSHNTCNTLNPNPIKRIYNAITKLIIRKLADEYIACGLEAGYYLFGQRIFDQKGIVLNNSVDIESFFHTNSQSVESLKKSFGITDQIVIGSVARLNEVKNHKKMLSIASELNRRNINFSMIFVGKGELATQLKEETKERGLTGNIIFTGVRNDINHLMHLFDVFLMPSHFEGNPVTLIESQIACLPAVISDNITDKIDLGLKLIHRLPISASDSEWADMIASVKKTPIPHEIVTQAVIDHGYDLSYNIRLLSSLYDK